MDPELIMMHTDGIATRVMGTGERETGGVEERSKDAARFRWIREVELEGNT